MIHRETDEVGAAERVNDVLVTDVPAPDIDRFGIVGHGCLKSLECERCRNIQRDFGFITGLQARFRRGKPEEDFVGIHVFIGAYC